MRQTPDLPIPAGRRAAVNNRGPGDPARTAEEADYRVESFAADLAAGDQDYVVGVENNLHKYLALPGHLRALHVMHGAGHSPNIGAPAELAAVLDRFISGVNASRAA